MKLSCLPVSLYPDLISGKLSLAEWARMGSELDLDAIDLSISMLPDRKLSTAQDIRRHIENEGMQVAMMATYTNFTHPDPKRRIKELKDALQNLELAAAIGAQLVRITAGPAYPNTNLQDGILWVLEGFSQLLEKASLYNMEIVYENHTKPWVWEYTDFSQSPDIFLEIVTRTEGTGLGVNFDIANAMAFSKNPIGLLNKVIHRVKSIHASDTAKTGSLQPTLLGCGIAPLVETFEYLHKANWDGWICIEEASNLGKDGLKQAVFYIRQLLK